MSEAFTNVEDAACNPHGFVRAGGYEAALRLALGAEDTEDRARAWSLLADTVGAVVADKASGTDASSNIC